MPTNHGFLGRNQSIAETLVIALAMIMQDKLVDSFAQPFLAKKNHALQAGLLDATHESLGVRVQIG